MQEEILEALRNPFYLVYFTIFLSCCMVSGSTQIGEAVELEFHAFRMQQYETGGLMYGSKNPKIHYEAVSLDAAAIRRCVIATWRDIASRDIGQLLETSVGALLIIIPSDVDSLTADDRALFADMENRLSSAKSELAIYALPSSAEATSVLEDVTASGEKTPTPVQQIINSVAANTFQFTSTGTNTGSPITYSPSNVIGRLYSNDKTSPTIAFVAHYDSHSVFPGSSAGADSNGSGVVVLMELLAVLSRFYKNPDTRPPYNLVFIWTTAGKYNFQGALSFIEDFQSDPASTDKIELAVCIEAVGGPGPLHMHASKQPTDGSAAAQLLKRLSASSAHPIQLIKKKINVNVPLSWEHERFNMKRIAAVTLSRLASPEDNMRRSILDTPSQINIDNLETNTRIIAEAVLGHMLSLPDSGISHDGRVTADYSILSKDAVDRQRLTHFVRLFASRPRSVADEAGTKAITANIASSVAHYSKMTVVPAKFVDLKIGSGVEDKLLAEKVKPAVFELFVAAGVAAYLSIFYHVITKAHYSIEATIASLKRR